MGEAAVARQSLKPNPCTFLLIILMLLQQRSLGSFIMDAAEQIYPNSTVREKNLIASLNTLKNMREEANSLGTQNNMHKKIEGICLCFIPFIGSFCSFLF